VSVVKGSSSSAVGSIQLFGDNGAGDVNANFVPWAALDWQRC
jgi:hypothetical protein